MNNVTFIEQNEVCERAVRRLARSRNAEISRANDNWVFNGVELDGDEAWAVLSAMPTTNSTPYGRL